MQSIIGFLLKKSPKPKAMAMENQQEQSQYIQQFVDQASTVKDRSSLETLVVQATSHPCLFAFSEILSAPNLLQLQGSEVSSHVDLLRLFAYGTWREYKSNAGVLPELMPEQVLKLKQLTVLTLAETNKVLSYDMLLGELEVSNVRELEDFLINDCMYSGIVKGKLDQSQRCFQVQYAAGRDPVPGRVGSMISTLNNWLAISNSLLTAIEEKIEWASEMSKLDEDHEKEVKERIDKAKEHLKKPQNTQSHRSWQLEGKFGDFNDGMDDEEDYYFLHKRRKSPHYYGQSKPSYS